MACAFDDEVFDRLLAVVSRRCEKAKVILSLIKKHDEAYFKANCSTLVCVKGSEDEFVEAVERHFKKSSLSSSGLIDIMTRPPQTDRLSPAGEAQIRHLSLHYAFFKPRWQALESAVSFFQKVATPEGITDVCTSMIAEFGTSITANHGIGPFEALVFIAIMTSFKTHSGGKNVTFHPQQLLLLCRMILNRAPSPQVYPTFNWLQLLPLQQRWDAWVGIPSPLAPDTRTTEIGEAVSRITSFPLMPEGWGLAGWNTHQINVATGLSTGATATSTTDTTLQPFPIFRGQTNNHSKHGGGAQIHGLDDLNKVLSHFTVGGGSKTLKLTLANNKLDLTPLVSLLTSLKDQKSDTAAKSKNGSL